jgi:hypothetical protein
MSDVRDEIADGHAASDDLASDFEARVYDRWVELSLNAGERLPVIWEDAGADITLVPKTFGAVSPATRESDWGDAVGRVYAAALQQAWVEIVSLESYSLSRKHSEREKVAAKEMDKEELRAAAIEGTTDGHFKAAKARRSIRTVVK